MNEVLKKADEILIKARESTDFLSDYAEYLRVTGDRSVDYSGYLIPLDGDYYIFIDFVDFSFDSYSIISKTHKEVLSSVLQDIE